MTARRRWLTAAAAAVLAIGSGASAYAGGALASGAVVPAVSAQSFTYTTTTDYWSAVAVQPTLTSDYDVTLQSGGSTLGTSFYGAGKTDFVAVDSNAGTRPIGATYTAAVSQYTAGSYWIEAQYGASVITLPAITHHGTSGAGDPDIAFISLNSNHIVSIADIYLDAGQSFWALGTNDLNELFLLEATAGSPSTYVQSRATALSNESTQVIDNCTLYTAKTTGWHALVLVANTPPTNTNPQQGIGYALHRYDPAQPSYCAVANFPGVTP